MRATDGQAAAIDDDIGRYRRRRQRPPSVGHSRASSLMSRGRRDVAWRPRSVCDDASTSRRQRQVSDSDPLVLRRSQRFSTTPLADARSMIQPRQPATDESYSHGTPLSRPPGMNIQHAATDRPPAGWPGDVARSRCCRPPSTSSSSAAAALSSVTSHRHEYDVT